MVVGDNKAAPKWLHAFAGVAAGLVSSAVCYPLDLVKTRLQGNSPSLPVIADSTVSSNAAWSRAAALLSRNMACDESYCGNRRLAWSVSRIDARYGGCGCCLGSVSLLVGKTQLISCD